MNTKQNYLSHIDGMRGIAVLSVVIYHAFPDYLKGGFVGVDIFFVISGFVISRNIMMNIDNGSFKLINFYESRVRRIFPSLIVVMSAAFIAGWYLLLSNEYKQLGKHTYGGSLFIDNFYYLYESGYFDVDSKNKPLLHLWSLGIEWQFYIIWPFVMLIFKNKNRISISILTAAAISFFINLFFSFKNPSYSFYSTQSRIWELLVGYIVAYYDANRKESNKIIDSIFTIFGIILILYAIIKFSEKDAFPGWIALFPVIGTGFILFFGRHSFANSILSDKRILFFGLISYPLYLWHWPLISYAKIIAGIADLSRNARIGLVVASTALSWATHIYIENPIRYQYKTKRRNIVSYLVVSMGLIFILGKIAHHGIINPRLNSKYNKVVIAANEWTYPEKEFSEVSFKEMKIFVRKSLNEKQVVYFGDSNIRQYSSRINNIITMHPKESKTAVFFTRGGCPPIYDIEYQGKARINCDDFTDTFIDYISKNRSKIDSVVIGASWQTYLNKNSPYKIKDKKDKKIEYFYKNLEKTIDDITRYNIKLYLILQTPSHEKLNPKNMINRIRNEKLNPKKYSIDQKQLMKEEYWLIRNKLIEISTNKNIAIIDPIIYLCRNYNCPLVTTDSHIIYKDSNHLVPSFVKTNLSFVDETIIDYSIFY